MVISVLARPEELKNHHALALISSTALYEGFQNSPRSSGVYRWP